MRFWQQDSFQGFSITIFSTSSGNAVAEGNYVCPVSGSAPDLPSCTKLSGDIDGDSRIGLEDGLGLMRLLSQEGLQAKAISAQPNKQMMP